MNPTKNLQFCSTPTLYRVLIIALLNFSIGYAQPPTVDDLAYATVTNDDGSQTILRLNLWQNSTGNEPAPLVIWIHGGAWLGGSYNSPPPPLESLLESGFAVASVQYRFSGAAIFPAQIHDVKGAVRFLRTNADEYNLDPKRFAAWGSSSGGHLTALLATSGDVTEAEGTTGGNLAFSSRIQAAVDYFGPTDLLQMDSDVTTPPGSIINHDAPNSPESQLIGFDGPGEGIGILRENLTNPDSPFPEKAALVRLANPIEHVTPEDPPIFIAHGDQDPLVPTNQSVRLATALEANHIEHVMRVVTGAGHGFGQQGSRVDAQAIEFLSAHLSAIPEPSTMALMMVMLLRLSSRRHWRITCAFRQTHLLVEPLSGQAAGFLTKETSDGEAAARPGEGSVLA